MPHKSKRLKKIFFIVFLICTGCTTLVSIDLNKRYGDSTSFNRSAAIEAVENTNDPDVNFYNNKVKPIIESRCVACHACYDAPCQLKMTSAAGIDRGANKTKVYQGSRILAAEPNRMFMDAFTTEEWRKRDFYAVLNERQQTPEANTQASVLARMLMLKQQHPLPNNKHLDDSFDISLNRNQQCPTIEEFDHFAQQTPLAGMPYGLPAISPDEYANLMIWIQNGSKMPAPAALAEDQLNAISHLESFLNKDGLKMQLSARYIYEHLFATHLYFSALVQDEETPQFYNLVRSKTPPGQAIDVIATRRPFDDPLVTKVYYRLQPVVSSIVNKNHQPYAINTTLLDKWQKWFVDANFKVTEFPSYEPKVASNPFVTFQQLPIDSRYRFMLERAQNTIMGYIKGPVCRGQVALNVINDRFWVYFLKPEMANELDDFYQSQKNNLRLPAEDQSNTSAFTWIEFASRQGDYLQARNDFINTKLQTGKYLTIDAIWDGDGENTNATLTIFRHFDNATVVKGLVGDQPKTAWIIDYGLLERIHYLLVAGFDVYGNYGHQLLTRLYMDFLRMEGESNFLAYLPPKIRKQEFDDWYQKAGTELIDFFVDGLETFIQPSYIDFETDNPKAELFQKLAQRVSMVQPKSYHIATSQLEDNSKALLSQLNKIKGMGASIFPELTMIMIEPKDGSQSELFTLVRNSAHYNVNSLFSESDTRDPAHDDVTLVSGLLGSYPDAFWHVKEQDLAKMVAAAQGVKNENDYEKFVDEFGLRRTSPTFWAFSDKINHLFKQNNPIEGGWLDYNRLENR